MALYQHGWGVEFFHDPHAEVLGADGLSRATPGPMLLAPDGHRVAVGDRNGLRPDVGLTPGT